VWNLFVVDEQIMRAADCKKLAEKPEGVFRQAQTGSGLPLPVFSKTQKRPAEGSRAFSRIKRRKV